MCGRFTLTTDDYESVANALDASIDDDDVALWRARYNVAPGDVHWIVTTDAQRRRLRPATWGFVGADSGLRINARAESAHHRPAFRDAFAKTRCVIPADGFYEWTGPKDRRLPIWYHEPAGILPLAGLHHEHVDPATGEVSLRFVILTCAANELVAPVHDRMPVILDRDAIAPWLALRPDARDLLRPAPAPRLVATEVSARVNKVAHDDPECIVPTPHPRDRQLTLL